jgi:Phytanoyl-CoA dioxygenase (PhyH)
MQQVIEKLEKDGYCRVPGVFSPDQIKRLLDLVLQWHRRTRDSLSSNVPYLNREHPMVYNLQSKDYFFLDIILGHPMIEEILRRFLNDPWYKQIPADEPNYILRSYLARSSTYAMPMHIDSFIPYIGTHVNSMQVGIVLEDQTISNGCTLVVPGSHQSGRYADRDAIEAAVPIESQAGDAVFWDSRVWHATTENAGGRTRWAVIATFARWWMKQAFNIPQTLPQDIYDRLNRKQKAVLGFCSLPYNDETEGIDMKRGYETLSADVAEYRYVAAPPEPPKVRRELADSPVA